MKIIFAALLQKKTPPLLLIKRDNASLADRLICIVHLKKMLRNTHGH